MGDEAVVCRIEHCCVQKAVDEHGSGLLVNLVFDGRAALLDFDDNIDLVRRIFTNRNAR